MRRRARSSVQSVGARAIFEAVGDPVVIAVAIRIGEQRVAGGPFGIGGAGTRGLGVELGAEGAVTATGTSASLVPRK